MTFLVGVVAMGVAFLILASEGEGDLFDSMVTLYGIFLPPIAIPMLAGLAYRKASNFGALLALLGGIAVGVLAFLLRESDTGVVGEALKKNYVMTALTSSTALAGLILGTWLHRAPPEREARIASFFRRLEAPESSVDEDSASPTTGFSPAALIALCITALGAVLVLSVLTTAPLEEGALSLLVGVSMMTAGGIAWMWRSKRTTESNR